MKQKEKKEGLRGQLSTFIPECVLVVLGLTFVGLMVYNYIPGHNFIHNTIDFGIEGKLANFVVLVLSCSIVIAAGVAMMAVSIVGSKKDDIKWPHHISFITSFVFVTSGIVCLSLSLLV